MVPTYGSRLATAMGLVLRPLVAPVFERDVQVYSAPGRGDSPAAAAFIELLAQTVRQHPWARGAGASPAR
jgi:DNA-binding transcriptional LysR family regulator